jgi:uncharacterized protein
MSLLAGVAAVLMLQSVAANGTQPQQPPAPKVTATPIQVGISHELRSDVLGDARQINVWVPPSYDGRAGYNVIYLLDGALDQDFLHIAGLAQLGFLSWTFGPVIVVGVQTRNRQAELTPPPFDWRYLKAFPSSGGSDRFRRFLELEVIPFVEEHYKVGPRRALMGESLAGLFVVDTLLEQPALFHDYVAVSPSLWWDDRRPMRHAADALRRSRAPGRRLYLAMANEGGTMQEGLELLREALGAPMSHTVSVRYSDRSRSATHATVYHGAAEDALRWLYPQASFEAGPAPWYMTPGGKP